MQVDSKTSGHLNLDIYVAKVYTTVVLPHVGHQAIDLRTFPLRCQ